MSKKKRDLGEITKGGRQGKGGDRELRVTKNHEASYLLILVPIISINDNLYARL